MKLTDKTEKIYDMPKLFCPFERETINGRYVVTPKIKEEFRWVFAGESIATDKLDGTDVSICVKDHDVLSIHNRMNPVKIFSHNGGRFVEGIIQAIEKEYINLDKMDDGQYFGELIGPLLQNNPYQLEKHIWMPISVIRERYYYKFWPEFAKELQGKTDAEIFDKMSGLFKGLWSIYKRSRKIQGEVNENTGFEGLASEGIVFFRAGQDVALTSYENKTTSLQMCKLRRDMFDWFKGDMRGNKAV